MPERSELPVPPEPRELERPPALRPEELGRCLVLIPHPDDEVIGCGGLLQALAEARQPCQVILVSDGSGAGGLPPGSDRIRQEEFRQAMALLYPEAELLSWKHPDGKLASIPELKQEILEASELHQCETLLAPWPRDIHPDHAALGMAASRAAAAGASRQLLFYETWTPLEANRILELSPPQWEAKQQALHCHQTALGAQNYDAAMSALARYRALLLPGISASDPPRHAEAYRLCQGQVPRGAYRTRPARQDDGPRIRQLFREVFATEVDQTWWQWKYGGRDCIGTVALDQGGEIAGFYGVIEARLCWRGQRLPVCQLVDSMVAPAHRRSSRRSGPFLQMAEDFLSTQLGDNKRFALALGFPNERALRAGHLLGLYVRGEGTGSWSRPALPWQQQAGPQRPWSAWLWQRRRLQPKQMSDLSLVDGLFVRMQQTLPDRLLRERSADYWYSRFVKHPSKRYEFLELRRFGRPVAIAVLRLPQEGESEAEELELVDAVFADHRSFHALIKAAEDEACRAGLEKLKIWGTEAMLAELPPGEIKPEGRVAWPDARFGASLVPAVRGHYWAMGGDSDFR